MLPLWVYFGKTVSTLVYYIVALNMFWKNPGRKLSSSARMAETSLNCGLNHWWQKLASPASCSCSRTEPLGISGTGFLQVLHVPSFYQAISVKALNGTQSLMISSCLASSFFIHNWSPSRRGIAAFMPALQHLGITYKPWGKYLAINISMVFT